MPRHSPLPTLRVEWLPGILPRTRHVGAVHARKPINVRRVLITGALAAGAMLGAAGIASAATSSSTIATTQAAAGSTATTPSTGTAQLDPATMTHGPDETLLIGTQLTQATAAATALVPGATVIRAGTNFSGASPYEVHMSKTDGTDVTVELDANLKAITTISGFGGDPAGSQAPSSSSTSITTN
jgi:hypothetical protein